MVGHDHWTQTMSSPMYSPETHDTLVLLEGANRWVVPGVSRVTVGLDAHTDEMDTPGEGKSAVQLNEATAEVSVAVTMWTHDQWTIYQALLGRLRMGMKDGPAVFTSAHPEIRARRVKRLYFVSEQAEPYSPKTGYQVKLTFKEKLKEKTKVKNLDDKSELVVPGVTPTGSLTAGPAASAAGKAVQDAALAGVVGAPSPADGGRASTATPGYCSASVRVAGTKAGMDPKLFGASALQTEGNFRRAGLSVPVGPDTLRTLQAGDTVFWGNDPSGYGHVGIVVGRDKDGMPLIAGNNLVTYRKKGGRFDSSGRPIDRGIDARGVVRMDELSSRNSQPTSVGRPGGFPASTAPRVQGPAAPALPPNRPSQNIPLPPKP